MHVRMFTLNPPRLPPLVQISSCGESHTCHGQLGQSDNQVPVLSDVGIQYINWISFHCLNPCGISWTAENAQTVLPAVATCILQILATHSSYLHRIAKTTLHAWSYVYISVFAHCDNFDEIELRCYRFRSLHNEAISWPKHLPKWIIDNCSHNVFLETPWQPSG